MTKGTGPSSFVKSLKDNAIFQMSLSSKELFHSNFLAWLAEDEKTRPLFIHIMREAFGLTDFIYADDLMVMREYHHFDFCLCRKQRNWKYKHEDFGDNEEEFIPGQIVFVLENKFKSLPYKEQLQQYTKDVYRLNEIALNNQQKYEYSEEMKKSQGVPLKKRQQIPRSWAKAHDRDKEKPDFVLLTLVNTFPTKRYNGWTVVTYKDYASALDSNVLNDGFSQQMVEKYRQFIDSFSDEISHRSKGFEKQGWDILFDDEFGKIRCNDIWQKTVMHKCALLLADELGNDNIEFNSSDSHIFKDKEDTYRGKTYIGVNFFHGEGLVEAKRRIDETAIFVLQQQGKAPLNVGVVINKDKSESEWNTKYKRNVEHIMGDGHFKVPDNGKEHWHAYNKNKIQGFYYYPWMSDNPHPNIIETIRLMVDLLNRASIVSLEAREG